jgi:parallel beta-helix repeat protein
MVGAGLVAGSMLIGGCALERSLSPIAPTDSTPVSEAGAPPTAPSPLPAAAGIPINPGDDIQRAVNANPPGTPFVIRSGVHRRQTIHPKDGMSFVGEPGAVLDGEHVASQAFVAGRSRNVTVRGLRVTRYAPPNAGAAVEGHGSDGWLVERNEIDHNSNGTARALGVRIGSGWTLRGNAIHHNGWVGIAGYQAIGATIEGNEVYANPPAPFTDTIGEASNIKLFECGRIVLRDNYVHDGPFKGIWLDTSQPDMQVEGNRVVNHGGAGIWYEVSYRGVIRGNYVENAGYASQYINGWLTGGGIEITNSPDVSVLENTVVDSLNGIIGLQAAGYANGPYGRNELRNLLVQGNTVTMPKGQTGIAENVGSHAVYDSLNNRFVSNRFQLFANPAPFYWKGQTLNEAQWKAGGQS